MEENNPILSASSLNRAPAAAAQNVAPTLSPRDTSARAPADPIATVGAHKPSMGNGAGAPPEAPSIAAKSICKIKGIKEAVRTDQAEITSWKPPFEAVAGSEGAIKEIIQRADWVREPWCATPVPTGSARYGTTGELFTRLQESIAAQAFLPIETSAFLAYWALSTWFVDGLSLAPCLGIFGPPYEGDLVLRALRNYCRYPLMMSEVNTADFKTVDWHIPPTLLIYGPTATKQMVSLLGCTTSRGYLVGVGGRYKDYYGAKAIYLGEQLSADRTPRCTIQVHLNPTLPAKMNAPRLTVSTAQEMQNQLLRYRLKNLVKVYNSDFDAPALATEPRMIASALGSCIIDAPKLQSDLVSLLTSASDQEKVDLSASLASITLEASLNLCHGGKTETLVAEIAAEVNRIVKSRGERLVYSAEKIGHQLKKVGLYTRRLGKAGKGLTLDLATVARIHELAEVYGGAGLDQDESNLYCRLCNENK